MCRCSHGVIHDEASLWLLASQAVGAHSAMTTICERVRMRVRGNCLREVCLRAGNIVHQTVPTSRAVLTASLQAVHDLTSTAPETLVA